MKFAGDYRKFQEVQITLFVLKLSVITMSTFLISLRSKEASNSGNSYNVFEDMEGKTQLLAN